MNYFQADNLSKSYAEKVLFQEISFGIDQGQKVGFIAKNGAGKTTLLNIMMGKDIPDAGQCNFRNDINIAYLEQIHQFDPLKSVLETLLSGTNELTKTLKEYEELLEKQKSNPQADINSALQTLMSKMDELQAWDYEVKVRQILDRLNIIKLDQKIGSLSGGELKRVALAKVLIEEADFIILDEPTNHLDLDMIEWLEEYLSKSKLTLFIVTHDRYFLDAVCNEIMELDNGKMYRYKGNYAYFLEKKQERLHSQALESEKAQNLLRKETQWMQRQPKARTTKSKARIDAFYGLTEKAKVQSDEKPNEIKIQMSRLGKKILEIDQIIKSFDNKIIIDTFSYVFKRGEKIGIVGPNGSGKSTFLNIITQKLKPDNGSVTIGDTIKYGYYRQEGIKVDENKRVLEVIQDIAESIPIGEKGKSFTASQFLHYFNFPYHVQHDFVHKLSGGEKRRLYLMTVLMQNPNFLILDEPTNDLDIDTLNVLEDFLSAFPGCLIVVSHDRYFLDNVVDNVFAFKGSGVIKNFPGNYTEFLEHKAKTQKEEKKQQKVEQNKSKPAKPAEEIANKKLSFKEKKEFETLETEIPHLESTKTTLLEKMNSGELKPEDLQDVSQQYSDIQNQLEHMEMRWLELSERI